MSPLRRENPWDFHIRCPHRDPLDPEIIPGVYHFDSPNLFSVAVVIMDSEPANRSNIIICNKHVTTKIRLRLHNLQCLFMAHDECVFIVLSSCIIELDAVVVRRSHRCSLCRSTNNKIK